MSQANRIAFGLALIAALAGAWLLFGLRQTNHDDHFFDLLAHNPDIGLWEATLWVSGFGRRMAHLLNVPATVVTLRVMNVPVLGDLALFAQLGIILGGFGMLLRPFAGGVTAAGWVMLLVGGFALHWYFMPPLAYPLHGLNSLMLLAIVLLALARHLDHGGRAWLVLALLAAAPGMVWPEYNFILYPLAIFALILLLRSGWRARLRAAMPFMLLWGLLVLAMLAFRLLTPGIADEARMTVVPDPAAWAGALGTLLGKGVLPTALLLGVDLHLAAVPGMPAWPRRLDVPLFGRIIAAAPSGFAIVTLVWTAGFLFILRNLAPRRAGLWLLLGAGVALMLIPVSVVALSAEYQRILRLGYVQGALATAHAQAGFLTTLFAAVALLALRWPHWPVQVPLAVLLGTLCTLTLAYNLVMRDVQAANQQRWLAFALMAEALPDGAVLRAPSLWLDSGVSSIPGGLGFGMTNYWSERARLWHGKRITVLERAAAPVEGEVFAAYGLRARGQPLVLLRQETRTELLARQPLPVDGTLTATARWVCEDLCRLSVPADVDGERALHPAPQRHRGLLDWWRVPRQGGFGRRDHWP